MAFVQVMDVIEMAIEAEKQGEALYRAMAAGTAHASVRRVYQRLAARKQDLCQLLADLTGKPF